MIHNDWPESGPRKGLCGLWSDVLNGTIKMDDGRPLWDAILKGAFVVPTCFVCVVHHVCCHRSLACPHLLCVSYGRVYTREKSSSALSFSRGYP